MTLSRSYTKYIRLLISILDSPTMKLQILHLCDSPSPRSSTRRHTRRMISPYTSCKDRRGLNSTSIMSYNRNSGDSILYLTDCVVRKAIYVRTYITCTTAMRKLTTSEWTLSLYFLHLDAHTQSIRIVVRLYPDIR